MKLFDKSENNIEENQPINIPAWHKEVLMERLKDLKEGKTIFYNWDDVKEFIFKDKDF